MKSSILIINYLSVKGADVKQDHKMKRFVCFFMFISVLFICLSACKKGDDLFDGEVEIDKEAFNNTKTKWEQLNIKDYTFDCSFGDASYSNATHTVVVRNGVVHEITPEPGNMYEFEYLKIFSGRNLTIDNLLREIESLITNPYLSSAKDWFCYEINAIYDATYHYPKNVVFKYGQEDGNSFIVIPYVIVNITRFEAE